MKRKVNGAYLVVRFKNSFVNLKKKKKSGVSYKKMFVWQGVLQNIVVGFFATASWAVSCHAMA